MTVARWRHPCMATAAHDAPRRRATPERVETLVVSGGGMKGVASLGAVVALRRAGALRHVKTVVGTSAGALVAAAVAVDRASIATLNDMARLKYKADIDLARLLGSYGIDSGRHLERWISLMLGGANYTFQDIRDMYGVDLVVCVTNLTHRRPEYLGPDTTPGMAVARALRMSCTIPLYFSAIKHDGNVYVDGAVVDNFPMAWASERFGAEGVLGIAFKPRASDPSNSLEDYIGAIVECSTGSATAALAADGRVLRLDTGARSAFEFNMSAKDMRKLYFAGCRQAREWYKKHV